MSVDDRQRLKDAVHGIRRGEWVSDRICLTDGKNEGIIRTSGNMMEGKASERDRVLSIVSRWCDHIGAGRVRRQRGVHGSGQTLWVNDSAMQKKEKERKRRKGPWDEERCH